MLILLIALTIALFGVAATDGPLQVALMLSAAFASLVALKNGHTVGGVADAAVGGVTTAVGAIFILLAVGALIGTWNMAGTIPTVVDYGVRLLNPSVFFLATAAICAIVGMVTGSSWTTAGTLGVAFVGMASVMGVSEATAAGAVICGAYFGDKMTPLSETTILVPRLVGGGLTVGQHIRNMFWTAGPALGVSLVIFLVIGLGAEPARRGQHRRGASTRSQSAFHISAVNLLPLALLVVFTVKKVPPFLAIIGSALVRGHPRLLHAVGRGRGLRRRPGARRPSRPGSRPIYAAMATGLRQRQRHRARRRALLARRHGEPADHGLARARRDGLCRDPRARRVPRAAPAAGRHPRARRAGSLILAVNASGIGLNVAAGDQYVADVLPGRMFRDEFARRGLAPQVLSRAVEDSGTVTSPLVPWNTCGAYMSGVLGVSTAAYLPFCFFNLLSPVLDVVYGFLGFKVPTIPPEADEPPAAGPPTAVD